MKAHQLKWKMEPQDIFFLHIKTNHNLGVISAIASFAAAALILLLFLPPMSLSFQIIIFLAVGISIFFILSFIAKWMGPLLVKKRQEPLPIITTTIDQNGIRGESENSSFQLSWNMIQKMKDSKHYILVLTKKKEKAIIPKRCFKNREEEKEVKRLIQTAISSLGSSSESR